MAVAGSQQIAGPVSNRDDLVESVARHHLVEPPHEFWTFGNRRAAKASVSSSRDANHRKALRRARVDGIFRAEPPHNPEGVFAVSVRHEYPHTAGEWLHTRALINAVR
jgi:hypothetical protein